MPGRRGVARRSTARRRIFRSTTKWDPWVIPLRFKLLQRGMIKRLRSAIDYTVGIEQPTKDELTIKGVPEDQWWHLIGFNKKMLMLYQFFTGDTLQLEKQSLINEYVLRGYPLNVLQQLQDVAEEYLGIAPPLLYCGIGDSVGSWYAQIGLDTFTTDKTLQDLARFLPSSMAIDETGHYLYVGQDESPAVSIVKIRLSDFSYVGTLTLNSGETPLGDICISGNYLYAVMLTSPARIVKVDLTTFTRVGSLTLNAGENLARGCCAYGNFLYATLRISWVAVIGRIAKINLTTFTRDSVLTLAAGDIAPSKILYHNGYLYTPCSKSPTRVVKVSVATFTRTGGLDFLAGENLGYSVELNEDILYVGLLLSPGRIIEVDLTAFTLGRSCALDAGENEVYDLAFKAGYLYAAMGATNPSTVVKVDPVSFIRVGALSPVVPGRYFAQSLATKL